jgi:two-component system, chemotaxis family, chemotaxis protein CheY
MDQPAGNVLIVEDDADTRKFLATALATEGFHAVAAEDGLEGLHLLRTVLNRAPAVPCLILLDLSMPRLSGEEFRRAQLADPRVARVPVAVLSAAVDLQDRARDLRAVAAVSKPIDCEVLLEVARRYCRLEAVNLAAADGLPHGRRENRA